MSHSISIFRHVFLMFHRSILLRYCLTNIAVLTKIWDINKYTLNNIWAKLYSTITFYARKSKRLYLAMYTSHIFRFVIIVKLCAVISFIQISVSWSQSLFPTKRKLYYPTHPKNSLKTKSFEWMKTFQCNIWNTKRSIKTKTCNFKWVLIKNTRFLVKKKENRIWISIMFYRFSQRK